MHHPTSNIIPILILNIGAISQSLARLNSTSRQLPPSPFLCSQPSVLLPLYSSLPQILVADSLLVLSFIQTQIPISELFPPSPPRLTIPESEEKADCHSWLCILVLLIRKKNCWASFVPAVQPCGRECLPWVVSLENLSAKLRWFSPKYHIMSPAKYQGLTRISLDFLRSCMNVFLCEQT